MTSGADAPCSTATLDLGLAWRRADERQLVFGRGLADLRAATEDDLREAVGQLPTAIIERLARGPLRDRYSCTVCEAFGRGYYKTATPDPEDPMWIAWAYHEVPKASARSNRDGHYGPLANEIYERCLATYRAAGWAGEAGPPDA